MEKVRELHFYTNLSDIEQTSDWDLENMLTDYVETEKAIKDNDIDTIKTTQLTFLNDAWYYIDKGFDVYIHISNKILKVEEHMIGVNGKDIRYGHNICRILCSGGFGEIK